MNKKISIVVVMMLAIFAVSIMPVFAAPKTKKNFELIYTSPHPLDFGDESHASPVWAVDTLPDFELYQKTFHARQFDHTITSAILTIDGNEKYQLWTGWSITGNWEFICAGIHTHQYTITQLQLGEGIFTFTGFGTYPSVESPTIYEVIYGQINPISGEVVMIGVYYSDPLFNEPTGYTFTAALTIDPTDGSMDGVLISQNNLPFVSTSGAAVYTNEDFDMSSIGNFNWNHNTHAGTFRTLYTLEFEDGDIELLALEKGDAMFNFEGTFVGHGTGELKGVKVTGTTEGHIIGMLPVFDEDGNQVMTPLMQFTVAGTIMGWD